MVKFLKLFFSLTILLCVFLPVSQCTMKSAPVVSKETGETLIESKDVFKELVLSEKLLERIEAVSLEVLVWVIAFFSPIVFSVIPTFSGGKNIVKLIGQTLSSMLLIYIVVFVVFGFGQPLKAGWLLFLSSVFFFLLTLIDWYQLKKHNKLKNANAAGGSDASSTRPF